jgi:hypothetical protein
MGAPVAPIVPGARAQVRGRGYLTDRKKVAAGPPMFALAAVDHVELDAPTFHLARCLPSLRCARTARAAWGRGAGFGQGFQVSFILSTYTVLRDAEDSTCSRCLVAGC